jgi:hypothetical protein
LEEFFAVTVIVEDVVPSDFTVGGEAKRSREATMGVVSGFVGVSSLLPPHPLRQQNRIKKISSSAGRDNLAVIDFTIFTLLFPRER